MLMVHLKEEELWNFIADSVYDKPSCADVLNCLKQVDHDDPENLALLRFNALWEAYYRHDSLLVFSTGRSPTIYGDLRKQKPLLTPDITIMSVGTEITYGESMVPDDGWKQYLDHKWDRDVVLEETAKFPELTMQSETEQRPHKVSFYLEKGKAPNVVKALSKRLEKRGVSNAQEELLHWYTENARSNPQIIHATERCAAGILQAIGDFSLGPNVSPRDIGDCMSSGKVLGPSHEVVMFYIFYERWRCGEVENPKQYMHNFKSIFHSTGNCVHPSGVDQPMHQVIDTLEKAFGDKKDQYYRVWIDSLSFAEVSVGSWLVKFDKWEISGNKSQGCITKVLMNSKVDAPHHYTWMHLHQTWLDGLGEKDEVSWLL
ncbi:probable sucrose-phosphatase 2 isoform X3 [Vigna radiata var. radiata]|uniref:Sucrose-phosphatase n=1 Tax=Vigna radiata var. radiata TaxID=3916 RepID=A0A3Q0FE45_VIGRR|nr:probable sucrose-phosphatase 2 isoform X3 [Vigna radiata var. radiata]